LIKIRNKRIALLLVLAMMVTMFASVGTAGAADQIVFSNAVQKGIDDNSTTALGWIKVDVDQDVVSATTEFYASVQLPDNVDFNGAATIAANVQVVGGTAAFVGTPDTDDFTIKVTPGAGVDYFMFKFPSVTVDSGVSGNIDAVVTVTAVDAGFELWTEAKTYTATIGQTGEASITATAGDPKPVSTGDAKTLTKVVVKENLPTALKVGDVITLELVNDDNFAFAGVTVKDGKYGLVGNKNLLAAPAVDPVVTSDKITVRVNAASATLADTLEITATVNVLPFATGDVEVEVYCDQNTDFEDATLIVGTTAANDVVVTAKDDADDIYVATMGTAAGKNEIATIKFDGAANFVAGDDIIMTLPLGFEWASQPAFAGFTSKGIFQDKRSIWYQTPATGDFNFAGLQINVASDAPVGDIVVDITGDIYEGTVTVGECLGRATFTAAESALVTGVDKASGNVTIVETVKDSLADEAFMITLPEGVEWAAAPTVKMNGEKNGSAAVQADAQKLLVTISGTRSARIDTIELSAVKFNIDNRVLTGAITAKITGAAINDLMDPTDVGYIKINDTNNANTVIKFAIGTVVDPTAVQTSSFVIGASTYTMNGKEVTAVAASYAANNRTYLAIRDVAHVLGIDDSNILWDGVNSTVTLMKGDKVVQLKVGSNVILINGASVTMDVAVEASNNRTFLPAAFVAQAFGAAATWDAATNTVTIK